MTHIKLSPELGKVQQTYIEVSILLCATSARLKQRVHDADRILHVYQAIYLYVTGRVLFLGRVTTHCDRFLPSNYYGINAHLLRWDFKLQLTKCR